MVSELEPYCKSPFAIAKSVRLCVRPEILNEAGVGCYHDRAATRVLAARDALAIVNTDSVLGLRLAGMLKL